MNRFFFSSKNNHNTHTSLSGGIHISLVPRSEIIARYEVTRSKWVGSPVHCISFFVINTQYRSHSKSHTEQCIRKNAHQHVRTSTITDGGRKSQKRRNENYIESGVVYTDHPSLHNIEVYYFRLLCVFIQCTRLNEQQVSSAWCKIAAAPPKL